MQLRPKATTPQRPAHAAQHCEPLEARQLLAADLVATELTGRLPESLISGERAKIPGIGMTLNNAGNEAVRAPVVFRLLASADGIPDGTDFVVVEQTTRLNVRPGGSKRVAFKIREALPNIPQGSYRLIGVADATLAVPEDNDANNFVASTTAVTIGPPTVNLSVTDATVKSPVTRDRPAKITLTVLNTGNTTARGTAVIGTSFTPVGGGTAVAGPGASVKVNVKNSKTGRLKGRFVVPASLAPGQYTVTATLGSTLPFADSVGTDNTATAGPITVR
jgi:hypothetical protein